MPLEPLSPAAFAFIAQVEEIYARLLEGAQPNLGGTLLYAGDLDEPGRAFTVAASIAGAAALAASADPSPAKQAMRLGQIDFLVNSLDEALRILKNQVRKHETVAVCVSLAPAALEGEMRARGVIPDFSLRGGSRFANWRAAAPAEQEEKTWLTWRVADSPAHWLPKLDGLALDSLAPEDRSARRWIERAPHYLGRLTQNIHTLHASPLTAERILDRFRAGLHAGGIAVSIEITIGTWGDSPAQSLSPSVP
jgi:hypothetical protein